MGQYLLICAVTTCYDNAVKGFWAVWDATYDCVFGTSDFSVNVDRHFTSYAFLYLIIFSLPPYK